MEEIAENIQKDVVKRLLKLIDFRNDYEVFDGEFIVHDSEDNKVRLSWKKGDKKCTLNINYYSFIVFSLYFFLF